MPADMPPTGEPPEPAGSPDLRASDADRDRVIDVLRAATADGRLTADAFSERMAAALSSRTFRELAPLTADLTKPPASRPAASRPAASRPAASRAPETAHAGDVMRIDQRGGLVQRTGRWVVPMRLELQPFWCDVNLDFTDAVIVHDTLRVDMKMRGGSLILVTGPGMVVDADSLTTRYTDVIIHPPTVPDTPVRFRIQLAGRMRYGYIEAR